MTALFIALVFFAWQAGYWQGRRLRPPKEPSWDWKGTALNQGWAPIRHLEHPEEFDNRGRPIC